MGDRLGVLVVHGMGSQKPGYSDPLIHEVTHRLGGLARHIVWEEVFWAHALSAREEELWTAVQSATAPDGSPIPLAWRPARQFLLRFFGDAVAYHHDANSRGARVTIHDLVSGHVAMLESRIDDPHAPVIVMAHSLGGHIMSDYIWDRQHPGGAVDNRRGLPTLAGMITFGCNIPLFSLAFHEPRPIDLPGPDISGAVRDTARWLNFLDRDDVVAWPLKPLYAHALEHLTSAQRDTVARIEDHEIDVGGPITRWNPASHDGYWTDDDFVKPIADYLSRVTHAWLGNAAPEGGAAR